jgi:peptidyl-tRNA hydrolase, PTH1 family
MFLFVGLGNPDPKHKNNRHNIGFLIIDNLNKRFNLSKQKPKFKGLLTNGEINKQKLILVKPLTFMNNSGTCIREIQDYYKIIPKNVFVFHDDLDLELGKIKAKIGGSSGGHNGIKSIEDAIGSHFNRIRIGIGHPGEKNLVDSHVLNDFSEEELEKINLSIQKLLDNVHLLIEKNLDNFSSKVNL